MEAVHGLLEAVAQLHLVDEEPVRGARLPTALYLAVQGEVLEQGLVVEVEQVDVDVVGVRVLACRFGGETSELARRVIAGEFGNGEKRRRRLGSYYSIMQARVNETGVQLSARPIG